jgi:uncharacterized protein GlcG (DUF336 family)
MASNRLALVVLAAVAVASACQRSSRDAPPQGSTQTGAPPATPKDGRDEGCGDLLSAEQLRTLLKQAPTLGEAGGLASGRNSWAAIVDRKGRVCAVVVSTDDPTATWPGSRGIAMAKANTANAFSTDQVPLSTARVYTLSQPGHSLWGIAAGNPIDPACLTGPEEKVQGGPRYCGGSIAFGGGVPLYRGGRKVGGLGVSGDTACTDHEIAKRVRDKAGLNPPGGAFADDITYSSKDGPSQFTHPLCANTWRNGQKIGDEPVASGY